jgi:hypothetical protein
MRFAEETLGSPSMRNPNPDAKSRPPHVDTEGAPPESRTSAREPDDLMRVRLTRKYAEVIDGVDLSDADVGDRLDLSQHDAEVLIAEGWAERTASNRARRRTDVQSVAADKPGSRKRSKR